MTGLARASRRVFRLGAGARAARFVGGTSGFGATTSGGTSGAAISGRAGGGESGVRTTGGTEAASIVPAAVTDYTTGHLAALGVLRALERRAREGGSWHVRASLARTALWIQSLPRAPGGATPGGIDPAVVRAHEITMETAWGPLVRLGPVLRMSETPPHWSLPPAPLGHHPPRWS